MNWLKRLNDLKDVTKIQTSHGNWNYDPYMQGLANGLLLAINIIETDSQAEYKPLSAPDKWLKDLPKSNTPPEVVSQDTEILKSKWFLNPNLLRLAFIVKRQDGYHLMSESKKKHLGGPYKTKSQAVKRLRQVEYFKTHK